MYPVVLTFWICYVAKVVVVVAQKLYSDRGNDDTSISLTFFFRKQWIESL
jgi:hypothetical protein